MDEKKILEEIADLKNQLKQNKGIPKGKKGFIRKLLINPYTKLTGGVGALRELYNQIKDGDISLTDIGLGGLTGPLTTPRDLVKAAGEYMQGKADGGMMEARKKGMGLKGLKMNTGGMALKPIPADNKGLPNLPKSVRNKMGFMKDGGVVKKRVVKRKPKSRGTGAAVRGTKFKGVF